MLMLRIFRIAALTLVAAAMACMAQAQGLPSTSSPAAAEAATDLPDPLTPEAVEAMVARMSDDDVRSMLLDHLDALAGSGEAAAPDTLTNDLVQIWEAFSGSLIGAVQRLPILVSGQGEAIGTFFETYSVGGALWMGLLIVIVLALAYGAERLVYTLFKRWRENDGVDQDGDGDSSLLETISFLGRRFLREIIGLFAFYVVARTVGRMLLTPEQIQFAAPVLAYLIWMPRLGAAFARFVLAPNRPDKRLVTVSDDWAKYLYRNLIGLVLLGGVTLFVVRFNATFGVAPGETRIGFWFDSAVYIYIILMAWTARDGLTTMMRGPVDTPTRYEEWVARAYPWYVMAVAAIMWVIVNTLVGMNEVALLIGGAHYKTLFWLILAPLLDTMIRGLTRHLVPPMIGEGPVAEAAHEATKRSYIRIGRVIAVALVAMIIRSIWNISLSGADGEDTFATNLIQFVITAAIGYIAFELASLWANRRLAREQTTLANPAEQETGGAGGSRLTTVLPLVLSAAQVAIVVVFALLALGSLGIDTTPLLASAGILGLAIGFGAQKLVADVVGGVFFLVDDAFRVGEYVDVGGTTGTVEKISIRSMQLRHHRGPVHTIPYGEIAKLTNYSRDWVIMKLKFTVPFETDPNKVKKIFKKIGAEMMADDLYKDDFLEPFKSQGVFDFDDVGMIIRGKFMAKPGTQFTIRKEIYNRVKNAFKDNGIDFARREVRVAIPGLHDEDLSDEERAMVAGAAGAAVQQATTQQT